MRALKIVFILLKAKRELYMRGELSRTTKSFQIEFRLDNRSYKFCTTQNLPLSFCLKLFSFLKNYSM